MLPRARRTRNRSHSRGGGSCPSGSPAQSEAIMDLTDSMLEKGRKEVAAQLAVDAVVFEPLAAAADRLEAGARGPCCFPRG